MKSTCKITALQLAEEPFEVPIGSDICDILKQFSIIDKRYIGVSVNHKYKTFDYVIHKDTILEFFDISHFEGERIYRRTITMMLSMAIEEALPNATLITRYSMPGGFNFSLVGCNEDADYSKEITEVMSNISNKDIKISNIQCQSEQAEQLFRNSGKLDKVKLMSTRRNLFYNLNHCDGKVGYFYGALAHSTGYVKNFEITKFRNNYLIYHPHTNLEEHKEDFNHCIKLYDAVYYNKRHLAELDVDNVSSINEHIDNGNASEMIKIAEASQSRQFVEIANRIHEEYNGGCRILLISGPSSSGKTTFSYKLKIMLKTFGLNTHILSMDNYFIDRDAIPINENGERDFERFENVDLKLFNSHLKELLGGQTIEIPCYDFNEGKRCFKGNLLSLKSGEIVVIEGIHSLNPSLVADIDPKQIFKIFLSPLATVSMDNETFFNVDDNRLIRRIIRDSSFRAYSATNTLKQWASVRRGERRNIYPHQGQADFYFNTSLFYELNVLKPYLVKLLTEVPNSESVYADADRLLNLISFFVPLEPTNVPWDSILREFIGDSSFEY